MCVAFFFTSRRRHTRFDCDWSSDVCSSDLRRAATQVGLVTADLESRLVSVALSSGRILRYVPTLSYPRSIESVGRIAVVAHYDVGAVSLVHCRTLSVTHVLRDFDEPRYTAGHPERMHAYFQDAR